MNSNLRYHSKRCENCRYFRVHTTGASTSECLALGRTLGVVLKGEIAMLLRWAGERVCDLWAKHPKLWDIFSEGTDKNPHWVDPYLPRDMNTRRTRRLRLVN